MRHSLCPRCDNQLNRNGHCSICGYQVKTSCHNCGHFNIPTAKYCGGCGLGTSLSVRYRRKVNSIFNPFQQIKIKRFFTGIAFGTLLALFGFSSMGMKYYAPEAVIDKEAPMSTIQSEEVLNSAILKSVTADLEDFCNSLDKNKLASSGELNGIVDIMIRNLNHIAYRTNKSKRPLESALDYLEQQKCIKQGEMATRGGSALMFFAYASDLLELRYKDYTQGSSYSDVPRFNVMDAPVAALKKHNVNLAYSEDYFGTNDSISIGELCKAAKQVAMLAVQRANEKAPDLTAPPEIIIEDNN